MSHTPRRNAERPVKAQTIDRREQAAEKAPQNPVKPHQLDLPQRQKAK